MKKRTTNCCKSSLLFASLFFLRFSSLDAQAPRDEPKTAMADLPNAPGAEFDSQSSSSSSSLQQAQAHQGGASITGVVMDSTGALVPGAKVTLNATNGVPQTLVSDSGAAFTFVDLQPGTYQVRIASPGMSDFVVRDLVISENQGYELTHILLPVGATKADAEVIVTLKEQAEDQVRAEVSQRAFGIFPNFYVVYDPHFAPLTTKLKFELAIRASTDPVTFAAAAFIAGVDQAADSPAYVQGAKGYGQRFGASYANGATDILIGGAILPTLLHQDPRYFYQGTGTKKSRAIHAMSSPFVAKGDNGRWQFNYSSIGGDLASASLSNIYYPVTDRGAGLVFGNALIATGGRMLNALAQEFVLRKVTQKNKN